LQAFRPVADKLVDRIDEILVMLFLLIEQCTIIAFSFSSSMVIVQASAFGQ